MQFQLVMNFMAIRKYIMSFWGQGWDLFQVEELRKKSCILISNIYFLKTVIPPVNLQAAIITPTTKTRMGKKLKIGANFPITG